MPRPAFEIFRVIHSLSLSRPASSSLRRPRCLSPFLHTRRPNRSCRVTPRLRLSGPVGAIFLATRTFSSFCAVLRQARLSPSSHEQTRRTSGSSAARMKISADWGLIARFVLASSSQLIRWLRNSRSAILLRLSVQMLSTPTRASFDFSDAQLHRQFWRPANIRVHEQLARNLFRASEPGYCRGSIGHRPCDTKVCPSHNSRGVARSLCHWISAPSPTWTRGRHTLICW